MNLIARILARCRAPRLDIKLEADTRKEIEWDLYHRARLTTEAMSELAAQEWWQGLNAYRKHVREFPEKEKE
jgi:hypothetical protein